MCLGGRSTNNQRRKSDDAVFLARRKNWKNPKKKKKKSVPVVRFDAFIASYLSSARCARSRGRSLKMRRHVCVWVCACASVSECVRARVAPDVSFFPLLDNSYLMRYRITHVSRTDTGWKKKTRINYNILHSYIILNIYNMCVLYACGYYIVYAQVRLCKRICARAWSFVSPFMMRCIQIRVMSIVYIMFDCTHLY